MQIRPGDLLDFLLDKAMVVGLDQRRLGAIRPAGEGSWGNQASRGGQLGTSRLVGGQLAKRPEGGQLRVSRPADRVVRDDQAGRKVSS